MAQHRRHVHRRLGSAFTSVGRAIVDGIKAGLSGAWGAFEGWFKSMIGSPIKWAKSILHIGSPSKVFAEHRRAASPPGSPSA